MFYYLHPKYTLYFGSYFIYYIVIIFTTIHIHPKLYYLNARVFVRKILELGLLTNYNLYTADDVNTIE